MANISMIDITKVYDDGTEVLHELNLEIADGEALVLVGPSGCGKSTTLNMIAGLEAITSGTLLIGGRVMNDVFPRDRDIAMVFQNYALYPQMTVAENLAFALKLRRVSREEIARRVHDIANMLGLTEYLDRKPRVLSGGQRQRVAMGRALIREPKAFLLDEPLSNLDAKLRTTMRAEISRLQKYLGVTMVYVTHDQIEAMTIGDRAAVINQGKLQQLETPNRLYETPANLFVAGFIGSPAMNIVQAYVKRSESMISVTFGNVTINITAAMHSSFPALTRYVDKTVALGIRPEDIEDASFAPADTPGSDLDVRIDLREELGPKALVFFDVDAVNVSSEVTGNQLEHGAPISVGHDGQEKTTFIAEVNRRSAAAEGSTARLRIDVSRLYFFDLQTGGAVSGADL